MINLQHGIYFTRVENQRLPFSFAPFTTTTSYYPLPELEHLVWAHSSEKHPHPTTVLLKPASSWNSHSGDARRIRLHTDSAQKTG